MDEQAHPADFGVSRRSWISTLAGAAAFGASAAAVGTQASAADATPKPATPSKRYGFKKSINLWAFPYPQKMSLEQCLRLAKDAGFDGIELNYDLESDLSPNSGTKEFTKIRKLCDEIGIAVSGLCSFLF